MDCSLPDSSVHGIFQARLLERIAISFSRESSWPRDWTRVSRIVGRRFTVWATREAIMRSAGLEEAQAGIRIARRNINNLRYAYDKTLMAEGKQELTSLSMKVKEKSEKAGLKLNIQKTKIMASGPIISWQIDEETVEKVSDFIVWGSKITADGDCSQDAYSLEEKLWPT